MGDDDDAELNLRFDAVLNGHVGQCAIFRFVVDSQLEFRLQLRLIVAWENFARIGCCIECGGDVSKNKPINRLHHLLIPMEHSGFQAVSMEDDLHLGLSKC